MHQGLLDYQLFTVHRGLRLHPNTHLVLKNRVSLAQLASDQVLHLTLSLCEKNSAFPGIYILSGKGCCSELP